MRSFSVEEMVKIQSTPHLIRNICILAHVDHGKTTLADSLLANNGIISQRMAGKMRYLDSRKDEQERGITMKSSCISLCYEHEKERHLINLIDSPGHVDFCGEVSAAVRLCDGALIVVDVVEGICPQTIQALKQAWIENLKPILIFNKIDRLITEQKLDSLDAYVKLQQLLEQINVVVGELFSSGVWAEYSLKEEELKKKREASGKTDEDIMDVDGGFTFDWTNPMDEEDDTDLYFTPESNNVIFASAIDGWGFTVNSFAKILSSKLGVNQHVLQKTLWGDYYVDGKRKRIMKGASAVAKKPLFVQCVLDNIWSVYEAVVERRDKVKTAKIVASLKVNITARDLNNTDTKIILKSILGQWVPLTNTLLSVVCKKLPSPCELSNSRAENLMCSRIRKFDSFPHKTQLLKKAFTDCSSKEGTPQIICVSKMFSVNKKALPENRPKQLTMEEIQARREYYKKLQAEREKMTNEDGAITNGPSGTEIVKVNEPEDVELKKDEFETDEVFIAFARVFSGSVKAGDKVYVMGPKYDPSHAPDSVEEGVTINDLKDDQHVTVATINKVFIMMGRELELVPEAAAGNVVGLSGLEHHILKSATLSDRLECPPFVDLHVSSQPILRVAIEPQDPTEMGRLIHGLKLLNQSDPNVIIKLQETGEHVIITPGEIHLQKCIEDLTNTFAGIKLNVSEPIVPFRETVVNPPKMDMVNEVIESTVKQPQGQDEVQIMTPNKKCLIRMKATAIPESVAAFIESKAPLLQGLKKVGPQSSSSSSSSSTSSTKWEEIEKIKNELVSLMDCCTEEEGDSAVHAENWDKSSVDFICSLGPKYRGPNLLINRTGHLPSIWSSFLDPSSSSSSPHPPSDSGSVAEETTSISSKQKSLMETYTSSFISGFQLATASGSLCEEPMMGVAFEVLEWKFLQQEEDGSADSCGSMSGQIMSTVRDACRKAFNLKPRRLKIAMFSCDIQVSTEALGKMYAVLGRRHGRVVNADLIEGSQIFNVSALVPVVESFQFGDELRKQTSGLASPQLVFSHWEEAEHLKVDLKQNTLSHTMTHQLPKSGDGLKWSRNLREESLTENNRIRLIQRQKQLLESKRQRQFQVVSTTTGPTPPSRQGLKSGSSTSSGRNHSSERLLDLGPGDSKREERTGFDNQALSPDNSIPSTPTGPSSSRPFHATSSDDDDDELEEAEVDEDVEDDALRVDSHEVTSGRGRNNHLRSGLNLKTTGRKSLGSSENRRKKSTADDAESSTENLSVFAAGDSSDGLSPDSDKDSPNGFRPSSDASGILRARSRSEGPKVEGRTVDFRDDMMTTVEAATTSTIKGQLNPLSSILSNSELLQFVTDPIGPNCVYQCTIIRDKRGIDRSFYPTYFMYLQAVVTAPGSDYSATKEKGSQSDGKMGRMADDRGSNKKVVTIATSTPGTPTSTGTASVAGHVAGNRQVFLLCGRRRKKSKTYLVALDPFDISRMNSVAKLKSNVIGTQFRCLRLNKNGERFEDTSILYDANVLGFKGPRKMTVFLPNSRGDTTSSLSDGWKRNKGIIQLKNKTPVWNEDSQSYVLNFHGRVTQASVKNFQLVESHRDSETDTNPISPSIVREGIMDMTSPRDPKIITSNVAFSPTNPIIASSGSLLPLDPGVCLQFGRVSDKEFTCDISYPLSPLQAFAIALSSFDSKLACE